MSVAFVTFVTALIYGSTLPAIDVHRDWAAANSPTTVTGTEWFRHHVDTMLSTYETGYLAANNLPPQIPWDGSNANPNSGSPGVPTELATLSVTSVEDLGERLRDYLNTLTGYAYELQGQEKAPFSYRYWGYMKWAQVLRDQYNLVTVITEPTLYDNDGTILTPIPFIDVFNTLHRTWHLGATCTPRIITPLLSTTAGQYCHGLTSGQDFLQFHRDHLTIWNRWNDRVGQDPAKPINMREGWPQPSQKFNDPSTWTEPDPNGPDIIPWINDQGEDTDNQLFTDEISVEDLGDDIEGVFHGMGHNNNDDIEAIEVNNFSPRFFNWHSFIDHQWFWREPRFATWDFTAHYSVRTFQFVQFSGAAFPTKFNAFTIVRDIPALATDYVSPTNTINGLDLTSGAGNFKFAYTAYDSYNRALLATLNFQCYKDVGTVQTLIENQTITATINPANFATTLLATVSFSSCFKSDDPTRANPAVGFVNSRIRVDGTLQPADGSDTGFIHKDWEEIILVQEKVMPSIEIFVDISTFSENQVTSQFAITPTEARFSEALILVIQDRTQTFRTFNWPSTTADEVKNLITGYVPVSGLFTDAGHAPDVVIWKDTADAEYIDFKVELNSGPILEDPTLSINLPQRYTYLYDIVFYPDTDAFNNVNTTHSVFPRMRVPACDRSHNCDVEFTPLSLTENASPYMRDGNISWLSIDTRVFKVKLGDNRFGTTVGSNPNTFIKAVLDNLNNGISPETFDSLTTDEEQSVLEFSTTVGGVPYYNFALAKIRLQGTSGATAVRAFFRIMSTINTNLVFDTSTAYRFSDSGTVKIPLQGFSSETAGAPSASIPCFAEPRVPFSSAAPTGQTDPYNVKDLPGAVNEEWFYFGAYLDINQANAKVPQTYIPTHPDGPFTAAEVQPIRNIIYDIHQCMVVEIKFDGNPTQPGDTPASSSNLAQRNLAILETDNPGTQPTHTVQHSFSADLRRQVSQRGQNVAFTTPTLINAYQKQKLVAGMNVTLRWGQDFETDPNSVIAAKFPLVFDTVTNATTTDYFDELLIKWPSNPSLPNGTRAEIFFPSLAIANSLNLRSVRHAPKTVKAVDSHTLELTIPLPCNGTVGKFQTGPCGVSYIPLPYREGDPLDLSGLITIYLPAGIVEGTRWAVNVLHIRGGTQQVLGGFQVLINTTKAQYGAMLDKDTRDLALLYTRRSILQETDVWFQILDKRVTDLRTRAIALAEEMDVSWVDPTMPAQGNTPFVGRKIKVVVDQLHIDGKPGQTFSFSIITNTTDNGGIITRTSYPTQGGLGVSGCGTVFSPALVVFEGFVATNFFIQIAPTKTYQPPQLPILQCACDAYCYPGQMCNTSNLSCATSTTTQLPVYRKALVGNVVNFVAIYNSATEFPQILKDWSVNWHIEYE